MQPVSTLCLHELPQQGAPELWSEFTYLRDKLLNEVFSDPNLIFLVHGLEWIHQIEHLHSRIGRIDVLKGEVRISRSSVQCVKENEHTHIFTILSAFSTGIKHRPKSGCEFMA